MKKFITILLLIPILFIPAIAQEDTEINERTLAPPQWILGIWSDKDSNIGYAFQEDDVRMLFTSYPSFMKMTATGQAVVDVDTVSAEKFSFYFLVPEAGTIQHYDFVKTSATTLDYTLKHGQEVMVGPVLLTKK